MRHYSYVEKWAKPERPPLSFNYTPMRPIIRKEAKGVVLIVVPFNYPLWLCLPPLVRLLIIPIRMPTNVTVDQRQELLGLEILS
jgi:acyl-CoA reductase-like NAD-dependent aldehyde dehydrogenase